MAYKPRERIRIEQPGRQVIIVCFVLFPESFLQLLDGPTCF